MSNSFEQKEEYDIITENIDSLIVSEARRISNSYRARIQAEAAHLITENVALCRHHYQSESNNTAVYLSHKYPPRRKRRPRSTVPYRSNQFQTHLFNYNDFHDNSNKNNNNNNIHQSTLTVSLDVWDRDPSQRALYRIAEFQQHISSQKHPLSTSPLSQSLPSTSPSLPSPSPPVQLSSVSSPSSPPPPSASPSLVLTSHSSSSHSSSHSPSINVSVVKFPSIEPIPAYDSWVPTLVDFYVEDEDLDVFVPYFGDSKQKRRQARHVYRQMMGDLGRASVEGNQNNTNFIRDDISDGEHIRSCGTAFKRPKDDAFYDLSNRRRRQAERHTILEITNRFGEDDAVWNSLSFAFSKRPHIKRVKLIHAIAKLREKRLKEAINNIDRLRAQDVVIQRAILHPVSDEDREECVNLTRARQRRRKRKRQQKRRRRKQNGMNVDNGHDNIDDDDDGDEDLPIVSYLNDKYNDIDNDDDVDDDSDGSDNSNIIGDNTHEKDDDKYGVARVMLKHYCFICHIFACELHKDYEVHPVVPIPDKALDERLRRLHEGVEEPCGTRCFMLNNSNIDVIMEEETHTHEWTSTDKILFREARTLFGDDCCNIATVIGSKTCHQVFERVQKLSNKRNSGRAKGSTSNVVPDSFDGLDFRLKSKYRTMNGKTYRKNKNGYYNSRRNGHPGGDESRVLVPPESPTTTNLSFSQTDERTGGQQSRRGRHVKSKLDTKAPPDAGDDKDTLRTRFVPCSHEGPCTKKNELCTCIRNKVSCESTCGCNSGRFGIINGSGVGWVGRRDNNGRPILCPNRFVGCSCKTACNSETCECFVNERACNPDFCESCDSHYLPNTFAVGTRRCRNVDIVSAQHKRVYVGRSSVHGFGLFAGQNFRNGDLLGPYCGRVMDSGLLDKMLRLSQAKKSTYAFNMTHDLTVDAGLVGSKVKFINHADDESMINCVARIERVRGDCRICIKALKPITAGQELLMDYQIDAENGNDWIKPDDADEDDEDDDDDDDFSSTESSEQEAVSTPGRFSRAES